MCVSQVSSKLLRQVTESAAEISELIEEVFAIAIAYHSYYQAYGYYGY